MARLSHLSIQSEADKSSVFLSYSHDDREVVDQLVAALEAFGLTVIFDGEDAEQGIAAGEPFKSRLAEMIRDADTFVFGLSPSSLRSQMCRFEVEEAARLGKRIIPVVCRAL